MTGRVVEHNGMAEAKRTAEYIKHKNMLYGMALREKLAEDKENRNRHQRADVINVKKGDE